MGCWGKIAEALAEIFVSSLATDKVAEDWMGPNVRMLFKKGSKGRPGTACQHAQHWWWAIY